GGVGVVDLDAAPDGLDDGPRVGQRARRALARREAQGDAEHPEQVARGRLVEPGLAPERRVVLALRLDLDAEVEPGRGLAGPREATVAAVRVREGQPVADVPGRVRRLLPRPPGRGDGVEGPRAPLQAARTGAVVAAAAQARGGRSGGPAHVLLLRG